MRTLQRKKKANRWWAKDDLQFWRTFANFVIQGLHETALTNQKVANGMRGRNKPIVRANAVHHVYQNTRNGYLIFYSVKDYLILFSVIAVFACRYGIPISGISLMPDHIHLLVYVRDPDRFRAFIREYTKVFTALYNRHYRLSGPLFNTPFGCTPKLSHKKIRSTIAYVYNNPVEGRLVTHVEEDRWNFLAYADKKSPFSEKLRIDRARWELRKALYTVKACKKEGRWLNYTEVENVTNRLSPREIQQFTDYVIRKYNCIDYPAATSYYGSYGKMVIALNANTGSEYDLAEDSDGKDYRIYRSLIRELCLKEGYSTMERVLNLPSSDRKRLGLHLMRNTSATEKEVSKLLRL